MDNEILAKSRLWTQAPFDVETRQCAEELINAGGDELIDSFYKDLDFGTGGMRGIMGCGTNRVNQYTLGMATQGLANYLKKNFTGEIKVAISFDCRHNSKRFSRICAEVLAANDIKVLIFRELRPTPALSFAVRHHKCQAGIMITASHNPPEYNGYKVYWEDGGQLIPPHDKGVIEEVRKVKIQDIKFGGGSGSIEILTQETDEAYLDKVFELSLNNVGKKELSIVFTSIHGTAITLLPKALESAGFKNVAIVESQSEPNGDFPTVISPNPEEAEALSLAVEKAEKIGADLVIGCDPDADRVGIAVRNTEGKMELLNGNQTAAVLIYYLLNTLKERNELRESDYIAKTIVTTDLLEDIARSFNVGCPNVLTGFKWLGELIRKREGSQQFIAGGEESYGYLIGDFTRDKDAISSGTMISEAAAWAKSRGSSLYEMLLDIYVQYGFYQEALLSITKKGKKGAEMIEGMMKGLREQPPAEIGGEKVMRILDYSNQMNLEVKTGKTQPISLPKSNVLQFITDRGSKITARPSGTEPKIKFYFSVRTELNTRDEYSAKKLELLQRIEKMKESLAVVEA